MQHSFGQPANRERKEEGRRQYVSSGREEVFADRRIGGEPAKFNTRAEQRRIVWENDLYERQSS